MPRSLPRTRVKGIRVPRFSSFSPTSVTASAIKRLNRSTGTRLERGIRKALRARSIQPSQSRAKLLGKPDLVFHSARVLVFLDGDFWHGRNWKNLRAKLLKGSNATYWIAKIESNVRRDRTITRQLRSAGWTVLRIWEKDFLKSPTKTLDTIERALNRQ